MSSIFSVNSFSTRKPDFTALRDKLFKKADKDQNGGISLEEFMPGGQKIPGKNDTPATSAPGQELKKALFAKIDTNGDGSLSKDEVDAFDAKASREFQDAMTKLQELLTGAQARRKKRDHHHPKLSEMFDKADTSKDGSLSLDEVQAALAGEIRTFAIDPNGKVEKLFARIDANNDKLLSKDEVKAFENARNHHFDDIAGKPTSPDSGTTTPSEDGIRYSVLMRAMNAYGLRKPMHILPMPIEVDTAPTKAATA